MSKRNFVLFIMFLIIVLVAVFGFLYVTKPKVPTGSGAGGTNFVSNFNPFNTNPTNTQNNTSNNSNNSQPNSQTDNSLPPAKLVKVSSVPVAGYEVYSKQRIKTASADASTTTPAVPATEFAPSVRYVNRITGNTYQTFADKIQENLFTTTIVPKVHEAYFADTGNTVVMRYTKGDTDTTIQSFLATLPKEIMGVAVTTNNQIKGSFLPDNISDMSVSPDDSKIFYLLDANDGVIGVTTDTTGLKKNQIFDSPFTEWLSQWPNAKMITLTTKASGAVPGYMYSINPNSKDFNKIIGGINGLTTLTSPDGSLVLYNDANLSLNLYHIDTKASDLLGIKTMPEKCVWGSASDTLYCAVPKNIPPALYPDAWYKGQTSFADAIWKIDVKTGNTTMLIDPGATTGAEVDAIKPALDQGENYLFFVNKKDSILWELGLK